MYSNNKLVQQILALLKANNISKVVISPGSRHFQMVRSMESDDFFNLYSVVDERSAGFFALGLIQESGESAAIICTSGSASINYGSAVSEAFYQRLPLLVLTADRIPEALNQMEDQMINQTELFNGFIKYKGLLKLIQSETDEWYCNRIINEALLELNHRGRGPVHLNIPILEYLSDTFQVSELPEVRKITLHRPTKTKEDWRSFTRKLSDKKVMIIWGQSVPISDHLLESIDNFAKTFDCVILTDRISNFHHKCAIKNVPVVLRALTPEQRIDLAPDIVISIGGNVVFNNEIIGYLRKISSKVENWVIGEEGVVCDPYRQLTDIFEMPESVFFGDVANYNHTYLLEGQYFEKWQSISKKIPEPNVAYSELFAIGKLLHSLPEKVVLQLANSITIRMAHLFDFPESIWCFCNRGVNGIDGSMSTAIGYAAATNKIVFLIVGDLSFFYDMNALWNRHLGVNLRILLLNNEGGGLMHTTLRPATGKSLSNYSSAGHKFSAKGWADSIGMKYLNARNSGELENAIESLVNLNLDKSMLLEVFTEKEQDVIMYKEYLSNIYKTPFGDKFKRKVKSITTKVFPK